MKNFENFDIKLLNKIRSNMLYKISYAKNVFCKTASFKILCS